jgi:class 3 adenylate cyclase
MQRLSAILIIDGQTTYLIRLKPRLANTDVEAIAAPNQQDTAEKIAAEAFVLHHPVTKMSRIGEGGIQRILQGHGIDQDAPIMVMTTKNALEHYSNSIQESSMGSPTASVHGPELLAHSQTIVKMPPAKDYNLKELGLIAEHFAKFAPRTVKRYVGANPEEPALSKCERDVSVLFLDICNYARLSEKLSLKVLNRLVERYFSIFLDRIYEADGDINEITGDGFMAIFQDTSPQKHTIKAVDTSLALLAATEALNRENHQQPLDIHMGLNSGLALVGLTRLEGLHDTRWTFTASGPMTNLAARLADLAKPGQILVGPETVQRLGAGYDVRKLSRVYLKNLTDPVDIYSLGSSPHTRYSRGCLP